MTFKCDNIIYDRHPYFEKSDDTPANVALHYCQDDSDANRTLAKYLNGTRNGQQSDLLIRFSLRAIVANTIEGYALSDGKLTEDARPNIEALKAELQAALALVEAVEYQTPPSKSTQTWTDEQDSGDYTAIG